ncbi:uncharacterized protein LOC114946687 [Nylanderia fulva]|uniref:uncharacterized protein LOC114946687 n=1 Tax=Nylanderia fulva TaxID=613905 RepID=UPI0010FB4E0D|nr:uncharacterized protein LOC114946687 [Nylanderia fulva]
MSDFENGLIAIRATVQFMSRIAVNYKKAGKEKFTITKTKLRMEQLREHWQTCCKQHVELLQVADKDDLQHDYFTDDEISKAEAVFEDSQDFLASLLDKQELRTPSDADQSSISVHHPSGHGSSAFALPRITIPIFKGEMTKWESFRDTFQALVGANETLSDAQKLHYLKSFMDGDAALLLKHITTSDLNYAGAWQILLDEYNNARSLVHAHIHAFASLTVMKTENAAELKLLRDTVTASLSALSNLGRDTDQWDDLLVYIVTQKFSSRTRTEWNLRLGASTDYPTFKTLREFITERLRGLSDLVPLVTNCATAGLSARSDKSNKIKATVHNTTDRKCPCCQGNHFLSFCQTFRKRSLDQRGQLARQARVCFNCLRPGHFPLNCPSEKRCNSCQRAHHSLLHRDNIGVAIADATDREGTKSRHESAANKACEAQDAFNDASTNVATNYTVSLGARSQAPIPVLLATARVRLHTVEGRTVQARALFDQGSTYSFISEALAQRLRPTRRRANLHITGFGEEYSGIARAQTSLLLESCLRPGSRLPISVYIYQKITAYAATQAFSVDDWPHLKGLELADPDPSNKENIEVLIGADLYGSLLLGPIQRGPPGSPTAQLTSLGWIVSGPAKSLDLVSLQEATVMSCVAAPSLDELIQKFWETEEIPSKIIYSPEEELCETHFSQTHSRNADGRYIIRLPFRNNQPPVLGDSYNLAQRLYSKTERRLLRNSDLAAEYNKFLAEYEVLGHMEQVRDSTSRRRPVYLPHHPVIRESSSTTKVRVVFNASSVTSNGFTLNDCLLVGPKLQNDLGGVLLNWRFYRYVYLADIEKMFRQILVHPDDVDYQRIVWRPNPQSPVLSYRLLTVTYGTASAPYLAIRVRHQLADDESRRFPQAAKILKNSAYVDDLLFGANDIASAIQLRAQLNDLMHSGGFHLRKWAANDPQLLSIIPSGDHELSCDHAFEENTSLKVLGVAWRPTDDVFFFRTTEFTESRTTKRTVLSFIARLFDPLGWASPVVIVAKILMQDLWLQKIDWDEIIPASLLQRWQDYVSSLPKLSNCRMPRWLNTYDPDHAVEIHGFADASQRAYAAVVYLRVRHSPNRISVSLLAAKSKVAPLKTIAIPRLELMAIVLLARLINHVLGVLENPDIPIYGWTDSTVALAWVSQHPSKWRTFVATRVSEIQTKLPTAKWHHVPTISNPADCASRGISVEEFRVHPLWWSGPAWLKDPPVSWPERKKLQDKLSDEIESNVNAEVRVATVDNSKSAPAADIFNIHENFTSWGKLLRVTGHVFRLFRTHKTSNKASEMAAGVLTSLDVKRARIFWIQRLQALSFNAELIALRGNSPLSKSSPLRSLTPFLDENGIIRLGGRLRHSLLSYDERFPVILPRHRITELIVDQAHLRSSHGGPQLTLRVLRQNFWILGARSLVKFRIRKCMTCIRESARTASQLMGDLPSPRVTPSPTFSHCGIDYAGPLQIIPYVGRGQTSRKYYVCIFVCLATRAIHLEYVSDYSSEGFLAAFRRFVSRRGLPSDVYSDNGTNFVGADRELRLAFIKTCKDRAVHDHLVTDGVQWHFIPAASPHFGGLWEAGVKSFKYHLKRVIGGHTLSQLEFATLLCQIEACLNSRPLAALTSDPDSFEALTPGHFLIGRPLLSAPGESVLEINENRLSRWQRVQAMHEQFWKAWSSDYLHTLHQRQKWRTVEPPIKINDLVIIKNPLLPPAKWDMARVIETHPGPDGHTRVVTVRTASSTLKRPITKICPLIRTDE